MLLPRRSRCAAASEQHVKNEPSSTQKPLVGLWLHLAEALSAQAAEDPAKATAAAAAYRDVLARAPERSEAICGAGWALAQDRKAAAEAGTLLRRCRALPDTPAAERRRIDGRLSLLESVARAPAAPSTGPEPASSRSTGGSPREQGAGAGGSR